MADGFMFSPISIPGTEAAVIKQFHERMLCGLFVVWTSAPRHLAGHLGQTV